jgi:hypothetical protein
MPSELYSSIWKAMRKRQLVVFSYEDLPRRACPVILGYGKDGDERVFVYQTGGRTSGNEKLPKWKCLALNKVKNIRFEDGPWLEGASHRQAQTCVVKVDVDVNIPETLTRAAPLESDSPELLPPRDKR